MTGYLIPYNRSTVTTSAYMKSTYENNVMMLERF